MILTIKVTTIVVSIDFKFKQVIREYKVEV
jgi:hypothetical protein